MSDLTEALWWIAAWLLLVMFLTWVLS